MIRSPGSLTIARSCNLCILVRHTCFPQGIIYQGQLAMTSGSRGQLHVYMHARLAKCAYTKYNQAILHHIDAFTAYTLRAKHVILVL